MKERPITHILLALTGALGLAACGPSGGDDDGGLSVDASVIYDADDSDADLSYFTDDDNDGYSEAEGDCNDNVFDINPDAEEICDDDIDNNCNQATDVNEPDGDEDGYGPCQGDCDDDDPDINPGADEVPDGDDNDCDGFTDSDYDGDGYREEDGDCNDDNPDVYPGAEEDCFDEVDNDCNGYTDQDEPDSDSDSYGPCSGDCDDDDIAVNPEANEIAGDGIDNNCDNLVDEDIDGDGWTVTNGDCADDDPTRHPAMPEDCDDGIDNNCSGDESDCLSECDIAELTRSNVGCRYYAVDMDNYDSLDASCFAVIISNTHATDTANVVVERWVGGVPAAIDFPGAGASRTIAPRAVEVFRIAGNCSAPGAAMAGVNAGIDDAGLAARNAFRITSDLPVVAYQINPYEAAADHSTDASLLIAAAALDTDYYAVNYAQAHWPNEFNVVAIEDGTSVTITSSTTTVAGPGNVPPALAPGVTYTVTLNEGDNLQIATPGGANYGYDLSGTYVDADKPVALFSGAECINIPYPQGYCDHIEEQLMPLSTWGTEYVGARHPPRASESAFWRVIAAEDGTVITFDPAVSANIALDAGQSSEFSTTVDFRATSTTADKPFFLAQYMTGAEQAAAESGTTIEALGNRRGDPAMTISVPTAQYMDDYVFLSDSTYAYNFLVVVRASSADTIHLDCFDPIPDARFTTIGAGPYQYARITLSAEVGSPDGTCASGAHHVWGDGPFGIWVYGFYADTSYGYPGGMSLERIFSVE